MNGILQGNITRIRIQLLQTPIMNLQAKRSKYKASFKLEDHNMCNTYLTLAALEEVIFLDEYRLKPTF